MADGVCHARCDLYADSQETCFRKEQSLANGNDRVLGPYSASRRRGAGPLLAFALALGIGVSYGWMPSVPDTILLPDSLGPLRPPYHLAFGNSTDNIYVASESSDIIVVDGNTFQRIKRINTGTPVGVALLASQHNKLYCTYPSQGRIGIIDCTTNDTVGSIPVSTRPKLLCYSSASDKLYCGDSINRRVWVIDCATDTVRKVISTPSSPAGMVYDPTTNKVYAATRDGVLAISCSSDSIVASLDTAKWARGLCLNKRRQKLYVVGRREQNDPDTIYVVSTQSDSVIAAMHFGWDIAPHLACNEASDRLYALTENDGEFVDEYDCVGDTYIRCAYTPGHDGGTIACDTVHNRLLRRSEYYLLVLDCATFDVVAGFGMPRYDAGSDLLVLDPGRYRAVCPGRALLIVFDYKGDTLYTRGIAPLCGWAAKMCHNPATSRLYCHLGGGVTAVVDEQTNRMVKWVQGVGSGLVHSRTSNKFYYPVAYGTSYEYQGLGVVDGLTDSLIGIVGLGDYDWQPFPCWCPEGDKVYCFASKGARWFIAVVDCSTDSVVWERDIYGHGRWFEYLDNGLMLCNSSTSLILIDVRSDSILVDSVLTEPAYSAVHTSDGKKVFLIRDGRLDVRSASTLALLGTIDWAPGGNGSFLVKSDSTNKLYWLIRDDSTLAIDGSSDTVVTRMEIGARAACLDHTGRYLFCACYNDSSLSVYDTQTDSMVAAYLHVQHLVDVKLAASPELGRIYVPCPDVILAFSDTPPGVEEAAQPCTRKWQGPSLVSMISPLVVHQPSVLLDAVGRKVLDARPGLHCLTGQRAGVYFLRNSTDGKTVKILLVD